MTPRALLGLLCHADKALDLVTTAHGIGLLAALDRGHATLGDLARATAARPDRLYKFLDGLESLGLVVRQQPRDEIESASYSGVEPLEALYARTLGEDSIERDRDRYPWRELHGRLKEVLAGERHTPFAWPPTTPDDIAAFERSMALGCPPIIEALRAARSVFDHATRWLDVGGGDGTVAAALLDDLPELAADVYNLPAVQPLVEACARDHDLVGRLGFVGGNFLEDPLPNGYQVISFVRVLHDWPTATARALLVKAMDALPVGGRIVICEELRDPDRLAVQFFWTYFLVGADACWSRLREASWYTATLAELGFIDIRVLPGPFDLIVASRSRSI